MSLDRTEQETRDPVVGGNQDAGSSDAASDPPSGRLRLASLTKRVVQRVAPKYRFGIGFKIAILFCIGILVTTAAIALTMSHRFGQALVDEKLKTLAATSQTVAMRMALSMQTLADDVLVIAGTPPIQGMIRAEEHGGIDPQDGSDGELWRKRLEVIFFELLKSKPHYLQARYISAQSDGRELVRVDRNLGELRVRRADELQAKGQWDYVKQTAQLPVDSIYWSEINLNREHNQIAAPEVAVMRVATPIYSDEGHIWGVVVINIDMGALFADAQSAITGEHSLLVANEFGDYLWHPDPALRFGFEHGTRHRIQDDLPEVGPFLSSHDVRQMAVVCNCRDQSLAVGLSRATNLKFSNEPTMIVATTIPTSVVMAPCQLIQRQMLQSALVMALGSMLVAALFAKTLTRPLKRMAEAANAFADGDDSISLPSRASGETGVLARALEHMRQRIQTKTRRLQQQIARRKQAEEALREAHDFLDQRVAERTQELESANRELAEFAYVASHDLKEPLRMVASFTELLADEYQDQLDAQAKKYIQYAAAAPVECRC